VPTTVIADNDPDQAYLDWLQTTLLQDQQADDDAPGDTDEPGSDR